MILALKGFSCISMKTCSYLLFLFLLGTLNCWADSDWEMLESGLWLKEFKLVEEGKSFEIVVLKINPLNFDLYLAMSKAEQGEKFTAKAWAKRKKFVAVINASMYCEDYITSTGYMKSKGVNNNGYIHPNFGAFLLFDPVAPELSPVKIIDIKNVHNWKKNLEKYNSAVQNYRLISSKQVNVWKNNNQKTSISSVGMDKQGNILFIHCQKPIKIYIFSTFLLSTFLDIESLMYTEGGDDANLYIKSKKFEKLWPSTSGSSFWLGGSRLLPNVLGIVRK